MLRFSFFVLLIATISGPATGSAQESSSSQPDQQPAEVAPVQPAAPEPPSEQVLAAEAAISKADWKAAEEKLNPWLAAHTDDARALFDAGYVADAQNREEDAAGFYRRAVQSNPSSFEAHLSLGLLLARLHQPGEAREQLMAATRLDPGEAGPALKARAWRALARIDMDRTTGQADLAAASDDLLEALKLSTETAEDTLLAASIAERAQQPDQAEAAYRRLLVRDPKSPEAHAGLAHLLISEKKFPEAESLLRATLADSPDDLALNAQLATVLAAEDKPEALELLQKLHANHPSDLPITRMLAEVLSEAGDDAGSDALVIPLLAAAPNDAALLILHGQNLVRLGHFPEAYLAFDKASQSAPGNADAWSGLAFAASRTNHHEATIRALEARVKIAPENASTYFLRATAYDSLHQKAQAIDFYHRFLTASAGKFTNQEWQAKQRLQILEK